MKNVLFFYCFLISTAVSAQTTIGASIPHEGIQRNYLLHVPAFYSHTPHALVILLHGNGSDGEGVMNYSGFNAVSDTSRTIMVYPDAVGGVWTEEGVAGAGGGPGMKDIDFISSLIDTLSLQYDIDAERIYIAGYAAGGSMAQRVAHELSCKIAAVGSIAGSVPSSIIPRSAYGKCPVPAMMIQGTEDPFVPFRGGEVTDPFTGTKCYCISADSAISIWRRRNNCSTNEVTFSVKDRDVNGQKGIVRKVSGTCSDGAEVIQYIVQGGGHTWPGTKEAPEKGSTNKDLNATAELWSFFRKHTLRVNRSAAERYRLKSNHNSNLSLYPNPVQKALYVSYEEGGIEQIEIYDHEGRLVKMYGEDQVEYPVNVSDLAAGMYMLNVVTTDGETVKNMMVKE